MKVQKGKEDSDVSFLIEKTTNRLTTGRVGEPALLICRLYVHGYINGHTTMSVIFPATEK